LEGCGFESCQILDGNGVKAMPGSIPTPNSGSFNNWKERKYRWPNGAHQKLFKKTKVICRICKPNVKSQLKLEF